MSVNHIQDDSRKRGGGTHRDVKREIFFELLVALVRHRSRGQQHLCDQACRAWSTASVEAGVHAGIDEMKTRRGPGLRGHRFVTLLPEQAERRGTKARLGFASCQRPLGRKVVKSIAHIIGEIQRALQTRGPAVVYGIADQA